MLERLAGIAVLFLLGVVLAVWGVCLIGASLGPIQHVGVWFGLLANIGLGVLALRVGGRRDGALSAGAGWFTGVALLSSLRPGGDVLTPASLGGWLTAYLLLGVLGLVLPGAVWGGGRSPAPA